MNVQVRLFAAARQLAARDVLSLQLPDDATVAQLREQLARQVPKLAPLVPHLMIALDAEYADDDRRIRPEEEIACVPPVSGG